MDFLFFIWSLLQGNAAESHERPRILPWFVFGVEYIGLNRVARRVWGVSDKFIFFQNIFCFYPPSHLDQIHCFMFRLLQHTFLVPWQMQSCSYPWQTLLQRLLSQLVTEVGDECWHHWLIRDRSWYFSEKWDMIGRKWIDLESKGKGFMW